jgi:class 3 adenylate cyclase
VEPRIQYAKTKDGISIAFWTIGEGMPLVATADPLLSHIQLEWQIPMLRSWYERLAKNRMVVRFDGRGAGLSDREASTYSPEASVLDLETVVDHLRLESFALFSGGSGGLVAVAYAARHPERVSHLILWNCATRISDYYEAKQVRVLDALLDVDWETATETWARVLYAGSDDEIARQHAAFLRQCTTHDVLRAQIQAFQGFDVRPLLPNLKTATLVASRREIPNRDNVRLARDLASRITGSRLVLMEGSLAGAYLGDTEAVVSLIANFLGEGEEAEAAAELPEGMAVLLFADIAESTALTEQLGDAAFRAKARELDTSLRAVIKDSGGTPVEGKVLGDGVLAVFTSARQAIDCALSCEAAGGPLGLRLHLGIHAGDVIREGNNVYGGAVNIAARVASVSAPGEILVSDIVRGLARTSAGVTFDDRGEHTLKGVGEPQRLFAVRGGG